MSLLPPTPAGQLARTQFATPYYGLVNLALASTAYADESAATIANVYVDLPNVVAGYPALPGPQPGAPALAGSWRVDWGPCKSDDNSNLLFAASFYETGATTPLATWISIRGTDTSSGDLGLLEQIIEDIDGVNTTAFPIGAPVQIAKGTNDGLGDLLALQAVPNGPVPQAGIGTILGYVGTVAANDPATPIIVTGHSLGGCQSTVLATYLKLAVPAANIIPASFAAPTAGLADFAAQFDALFPTGTQWWNTFDVVPNAFASGPASSTQASLHNIDGFWPAPGPAANIALKLLLSGVIKEYPSTYTQPSAGRQTLPGFVWVPPTPQCKNNFVTQLEIQHFPPMYYALMTQQTAVTLAPFPLPKIGAPDQCTDVPANASRPAGAA